MSAAPMVTTVASGARAGPQRYHVLWPDRTALPDDPVGCQKWITSRDPVVFVDEPADEITTA